MSMAYSGTKFLDSLEMSHQAILRWMVQKTCNMASFPYKMDKSGRFNAQGIPSF